MRERAIEPTADTWHRRYLGGEHEAVWAEMVAIGPEIVEDTATLRAAEAVAVETMRRVRLNVELIHARLHAAGFAFSANCNQDWPHRPLQPPALDAMEQIHQIETAIGGRLPLSVRAFITEVGWVDFDGHLPGWTPRYTDGLQILTDLTGLGEQLTDMIEHYGVLDDEPCEYAAHSGLLELSADYLHKANISGGPPYGVAVPNPAADARWLYDTLHPDSTFVQYLRDVVADGGLPGWRRTPGDQPPPILHDLTAELIRF